VEIWIDPLGLFAFASPLIIKGGAIIKGLFICSFSSS